MFKFTNLPKQSITLFKVFIILFFSLGISFISFVPSLSWAQEKPERVLTLSESIKLATSNNQELLIVAEEENIANSKMKLARSQRYPKVIFSGAYTNLKVTTPMALSPMLGGTTLDIGISEYYTTHLSLKQFLYTGGYLSSISKEARLNLQEVESDYKAVKRKIILEVTRNFYSVLLSRQIVNIYEDSLSENEAMSALAEKENSLYDYNLLNAEVQLSVIRISLEKAKQDLKGARTLFNKSLGIELNTQVRLEGGLTYGNNQEFELNKSIIRALQFSPELRKKKIEEQMYDVKVMLSKGKLYPSVVIGGDIAYGGEVFPPEGKSWTATLAVSVPIFDGWASWTRVKEAKSELRKTKLERVRVSDDIKLRVQQLFSNYERTKKTIKPLKQNRDLCKKNVDIATDAFKKKEISFVELLGAQMALVQAKINYVNNLHSYLLTEAELNIIANPVE